MKDWTDNIKYKFFDYSKAYNMIDISIGPINICLYRLSFLKNKLWWIKIEKRNMTARDFVKRRNEEFTNKNAYKELVKWAGEASYNPKTDYKRVFYD